MPLSLAVQIPGASSHNRRDLTLMSRQISERTVELLPQAEVAIHPSRQSRDAIAQHPEAVATAIASFVEAHS